MHSKRHRQRAVQLGRSLSSPLARSFARGWRVCIPIAALSVVLVIVHHGPFGLAGPSGAWAQAAPAAPAGTTGAALEVQQGDLAIALKGGPGEYAYDPSGRRDPFTALIQRGRDDAQSKKDLPPLQRVGLTELNLIGIIWGGFGYTAMVRTPDGKGYAVRQGTRIGPNDGVVSKITEAGIVVMERFTDVYGKQQEREYIKLLHAGEGSD